MPERFTRRMLDAGRYEACCFCDIDGDGAADLVCGAYWYKGPDFTERHRMCDVPPDGDYYDDFGDIPVDITGSGCPDIVSGGWFGKRLRWREHPGFDRAAEEWRVHEMPECGCIEAILAYDLDGCGKPEILPNTPNDPQTVWKAEGGTLVPHVLSEGASGHGLGVGDIDGCGRAEILLADGYLKQTGGVFDRWEHVPAYRLGFPASVPILCADVDGDGRADLVVGNGHGYGLFWYRQTADGGFERNVIDMAASQYHALVPADGGGAFAFYTGKRWHAHCGRDPGAEDPVGLYLYRWNAAERVFVRHMLAFGEIGAGGVGAGIAFAAGPHAPDGGFAVAAPGKDGLYLFTRD